MNRCIFILLGLLCSLPLLAQTNEPLKLALISEADVVGPVADMLTAKLSGNGKIQLLERDQLETIYREQNLSAANKDYLKLGRMLGADGLLLLDAIKTPVATNLAVRLIAVKPGVIVVDYSFAWPITDLSAWSEDVAIRLNKFLPKLQVRAGEAIPISIVNLRSAINSQAEAETERELKVLAIQRLSQERQIFVLERQQLQLLGEEKGLKGDDSAFWDGSYLLDGIIDQNGYSPEILTVNAQLISSQSGAGVAIEVSGSRTNLAEIVNQLAGKVNAALKINASLPAWNTADEAAKYFEEAEWAERWGAYAEAQAAAESAWVLGQPNEKYNRLRITTYLDDLLSMESPNEIQFPTAIGYHYRQISPPPDPKDCDKILYALGAYYDFIRDHTNEIYLEITDNHRDYSDWYQLGVETVSAAGKILQRFNYRPASQKPVAEKLAQIRSLTRSVVGLILQAPSIRDSYFVGDRLATEDELTYTVGSEFQYLIVRQKVQYHSAKTIFQAAVKWGCLWQETPEAALAFYRQLMSSPTFRYIHADFWSRDVSNPRLAGWSEHDRQSVPRLWSQFLMELENSTNILWRMEAKGLERADATDAARYQAAEKGWWDIVHAHRDELVANKVELFYLGWGFMDNSETQAMEREYRDKTVPLARTAAEFERQKKYLADFTPYTFQNFETVFNTHNYTKTQAAELLPLIAAYKSNMWAKASTATANEQFFVKSDIEWVEFSYERKVKEILFPSTPPIVAHARAPEVIAHKPNPNEIPVKDFETVTNVIIVRQFLPVPLDGLVPKTDTANGVNIIAHHWQEGKLLLDLKYTGHPEGGINSIFSAIAVLDPLTRHWDVATYPEALSVDENVAYAHSVLWHGDLFSSNNHRIQKYDFSNRRWKVVPVSSGDNCELFVVNGHLYATTSDSIWEIIDGGKSTRILASARRQPPATVLDRETLGQPFLFEGPDHSLRVSTAQKIFTWTSNDWREDLAMPRTYYTPVQFSDGLLLFPYGFEHAASLVRLLNGSNKSELCLQEKRARLAPNANRWGAGQKPLWELPPEISLATSPTAILGSDLYLLTNYSKTGAGYHTELFCFSHGDALPQKLFLKFEATGINPPTGINTLPHRPSALPSSWMLFTTNLLILGEENIGNLAGAYPGNWLGHPAGVWVLPLSQIEPVIAAQEQFQLAAQKLAAAKTEQGQKDFLVKYDFNHDGMIDLAEREQALDDTAFIAAQLDLIDTNHNGWLDGAEVAYFDANQNKILEPRELAGIGIALHLLAARIMRTFDVNNDGVLDLSEFSALGNSVGKNFYQVPGSFSTRKNVDQAANFMGLLFSQEFRRLGIVVPRPPDFPRPKNIRTNMNFFKP
ncbi:MAG TPA: EF-hand domain-containing protein [Verrucomicrobiae bacterium]|jgi:curli biogenesis system outer membrane secretion channel CsgG